MILAGEDKGIEAAGAADGASRGGKRCEREGFVRLSRSKRSGKSKGGDVKSILLGIASLIFIVTRKGVAQLQDGGGTYGVVIANDEVTPVGDVLGVVGIPTVAKGVDARVEAAAIGEAGEEALLFAHVVLEASVESVRLCGIQTWNMKVAEMLVHG